MTLRGLREQFVQGVLLELGLLVLAVPAYSALFGADLGASLALMLSIMVILLVFTPLYCAVFDRIELYRTGRVASDRPPSLRLVHAVGHELVAMLLTVPLILWMTGLPFVAALTLDLTMTLAAVLWVWLFYAAWDRARPLHPAV